MCKAVVLNSGLNSELFYSLLLVESLNVGSKYWPKEYKLAEFSHHSEPKAARASFFNDYSGNFVCTAELTKVPKCKSEFEDWLLSLQQLFSRCLSPAFLSSKQWVLLTCIYIFYSSTRARENYMKLARQA